VIDNQFFRFGESFELGLEDVGDFAVGVLVSGEEVLDLPAETMDDRIGDNPQLERVALTAIGDFEELGIATSQTDFS
jgi:hypothetical protein